MSNKFVCYKIKSLKFPDKKWDSSPHFFFTTQDRAIERTDKREQKKIDYSTKWAEAKSVGIEFLDKSKSFVYFVLYAPKELIDFSYNTFYKPHEDKGIWKIEEVFDISLNLDVDVEEKIFTEFSKSYVKHLGNNGDK